MKHIYCISGFGADERVFSKLNFNADTVTFIQWTEPLKNESIDEYAKRLIEKVHHKNPILIGLSFGGMMCIEIAKIISVSRIVIISSIKTYHEMPLWMRLSGKLNLHKIAPSKSYKIYEPLENYNLGIKNKDELQLVREYRSHISKTYTKWAINEILHWKNNWIPENIIHIHGSDDHIFPVKKLKADHVINGGGHFMIMNKAAAVNEIFRTIL